MNRARNDIVASIARAKIELDDALEDLKGMPMVDPMVLGFVAHALRNYLNVAHGTAQLLGEALKDHPRKEVGLWLDGMLDVTSRMTRLIGVMQAAPPKTDPKLKLEKIDFATLVQRACVFYQRIGARKQIEVSFEVLNGPIPKVRADRIAVAAILDNLLSNAVKFSMPGKRVWVEVEREVATVVCRVRDEGPGVALQDVPLLFQRELRLKARAEAGERAEGYGLAVAADLVAHLGGEIGCESDPGKGACFFFRLNCPRSTRPRSRLATKAKSPR